MLKAKSLWWQIRCYWAQIVDRRTQKELPDQAGFTGIPYFGQFESSDKVEDFFSRKLLAIDDPKWQNSGASSAAEYADWAWHMCGVTCFKMALAHANGRIVPTVELAKACQGFGGYLLENNTVDAKGLRYKPFGRFIAKVYDWNSKVVSPLTIIQIQKAIWQKRYVIASVHPSIYKHQTTPAYKGGHLVLITGYNQVEETLTYNDPWGREGRQSNVAIPIVDFLNFFAVRGIIIWP